MTLDITPHLEKRIVVLGNGPSMAGFDFAKFKHVKVIGMNAAYRYWDTINWYPNYYACLDLVVGQSHGIEIKRLIENAEKYEIEKFLLRDELIHVLGNVRNVDRIVSFETLRKKSKIMQVEPITTGSHSAAWAIDMGFQNIFLMGIDGSYVEIVEGANFVDGTELEIVSNRKNPNYFIENYQQVGDRYNVPNPNGEIHLTSWDNIAAKIKKQSTKILNTNFASRIDTFDFCNFEDIVEKSEITAVNQKQSRYLSCSRAMHIRLDETEVISDLLKNQVGGTMVDVGAHTGSSAHHFADKDWNIFCFEPDGKNREKLLAKFANSPNVHIDDRGVGREIAKNIPFYKSEESTGISGMLAFRNSHKKAYEIDVTTVKDIVNDRKIQHLDFLKIDVEGYDFDVLKGVPWTEISPNVIECEFEDAKTSHLGHSWVDICEYLTQRNYTVYLSEWHPIVQYGTAHDWHSLKKYPCVLGNPNAWGNILAFRKDPGTEQLKSLFEKAIEKSNRLRSEGAKRPHSSRPKSADIPKRKFYGDFGDWLRDRSPQLFKLAKRCLDGCRSVAGIFR